MATTPQTIPLAITIAPFPEGFQGDMDETFQQATQLMTASMTGNFLTGLILPPGSTLPTSDQGPIAMGNVWYFWDSTTGQYLPQTVSSKIARNFVKNCVYQIQQTVTVPSLTLGAGVTNTYDMTLGRSTLASILAISTDVGPLASADNDYCPAAIKYTVPGPTFVPTPGATDLYAHEHLIEGTDISMIRGETLSLSFGVWVNQPGTYSYYLTSTGRDASYVGQFTIVTASAWTRIKVPSIPALPTGIGTWNFGEGVTGLYIGIPMCIGSQWRTTNLNNWQSGFFAASSATGNLCTAANNQIKISGVKLEASPAVSYLSVPSVEQDFLECTRYYFTTFTYQSVTAGVPIMGMAQAANGCFFAFTFPRRMAKTPTVVPYGWNSHTAGNITNVSTGTDFAVAGLSSTPKGVASSATPTSTAKGDVFLTIITADARLS
jgi:hypothetical protein